MINNNYPYVAIIVLIMVICLSTSIFIHPCAAEEEKIAPKILIIAHLDVNQVEITPKEIKAIFLGNQTRWADEESVTFFLLKEGKTHDQFLQKYIEKTPSQFDRYWKQLLFTGKGKMPKRFKTELELMRYVAKTKGAVGYISSTTQIENVKKIIIKES